jgi:alpha-ketoglutarate-dependent taurine dioxygenase
MAKQQRQFVRALSADTHLVKRVRRYGFALSVGCRPELATRDFADLIGVRDDIADIPPVQSLTPKFVEASSPNMYSGNFGYGTFPLHTDLAHWFLPPRYILLRCRRGDERVSTNVMTWAVALRNVPEGVMYRARFRPRRAIHGRVQLLPFRQIAARTPFCRWDSLFLRPDNVEAETLATHLTGLTPEDGGKSIVLREPGDTLILDNWRVLHGRSTVPGGADARTVERVYLKELQDDG